MTKIFRPSLESFVKTLRRLRLNYVKNFSKIKKKRNRYFYDGAKAEGYKLKFREIFAKVLEKTFRELLRYEIFLKYLAITYFLKIFLKFRQNMYQNFHECIEETLTALIFMKF